MCRLSFSEQANKQIRKLAVTTTLFLQVTSDLSIVAGGRPWKCTLFDEVDEGSSSVTSKGVKVIVNVKKKQPNILWSQLEVRLGSAQEEKLNKHLQMFIQNAEQM